MQTLALSLKSKGAEGESLPTVFKQLAVYGANIRRSQLTLVGAASGTGKSSFMTYLSMVLGWDAPTLYFSADSDIGTVGIRAGAMILQKTTMEIEDRILKKDVKVLDAIERATSHIWMSFDSSPSPVDISDEVDMFAMVNGEYPHLIVIDNLMDVAGASTNPESQDAVLDFLKQLAARTSSAVVVLCHVTGEYANGNMVIPLSGLMNKIDKRPRLVLTLCSLSASVLTVAVVKNSNGRADPSGSLQVQIPWIKETMWFSRGD